MDEDIVAAYWRHVVVHDNGCWEWTSGTHDDGYGQFTVGGKQYRAHRVSYELHHGHPPTGLVRHTCDNPPCTRPDHLVDGTYADNSRDMVDRGRSATGERHRSRTHPESTPRGDKNGARTHPERLARGAQHGSKTHPDSVARGERHPNAKIRDHQRPEIRAKFQAGASKAALGREFGVTPAIIGRIVSSAR